jgi:hypothetical protein
MKRKSHPRVAFFGVGQTMSLTDIALAGRLPNAEFIFTGLIEAQCTGRFAPTFLDLNQASRQSLCQTGRNGPVWCSVRPQVCKRFERDDRAKVLATSGAVTTGPLRIE